MSDSIADHVAQCLQGFKSLSLAASGAKVESSTTLPLQVISNELARFRLWSANIGAHRRGKSSLAHRLRDASGLRKHVIKLLDNLRELLEDGLSILVEERVPWDQLPFEEDNLVTDPDDLPDIKDLGFDSELEQISSGVIETINYLLKLSIAIRNPAPHGRFMCSKATDRSYFEPSDILHLRSKFPGAETYLAERLGSAISRRRQYLKYRKSHRVKLAQGLDFNLDQDEPDARSTIASSIPSALKNSKTFAPSLVDSNSDTESDTGVSQTSFATTAVDSKRLQVPPLPKTSTAGPFECPFCYMVIAVNTTIQWKRHVFADLRPYICLHEDCLTPNKEFTTRHEWMDHVLSMHWKAWQCPYQCKQICSSALDLRQHIVQQHPEQGSGNGLDQALECPLCKEPLDSIKKYRSHVGRHQIELALFALPKLYDDEENGDGEDNDDEKNDNDGLSVASTDSNLSIGASGDSQNSEQVFITDESGIAGLNQPSNSHHLHYPSEEESTPQDKDGAVQKEETLDEEQMQEKLDEIWRNRNSEVWKERMLKYLPEDYSWCVHGGCGKQFYDPDEACTYHPGQGILKLEEKGWSCCKPRVLTVDEMLDIPGCTVGKHKSTSKKLPDSGDGVNRHSSEWDTGMENRELSAEGDNMLGPKRVDTNVGAKREAEAISRTERGGSAVINNLIAPKRLLEKLKIERRTAIRKRDAEEKDTEPDQDFIDEKNKKIEVLDLKIHNAETELALMGVTGEGSEDRKRQLEDELKDGKRKLKEFMDGLKGRKKQLEGTP